MAPVTTIRPSVNSNNGIGGSHETDLPPRKVRGVSKGVGRSRKLQGPAAAEPDAVIVYDIEPRAPSMLELHRAKLMIIAPPQTRARTLMIRSEEHTSELQSRQYLVCRL